MTNREKQEKVIKGLGAVKETLEDMRDKLGAKWCEDAIALLKAQEPMKPNAIMHGKMVMYYQCPACLATIGNGNKFCPNCGRAAKWDAEQ